MKHKQSECQVTGEAALLVQIIPVNPPPSPSPPSLPGSLVEGGTSQPLQPPNASLWLPSALPGEVGKGSGWEVFTDGEC